MTPTEMLKHEHQVILMVLDAAERDVDTLTGSGRVSGERIRRFLEFFRNFADRCHHAKEEDHLFRLMTERGIPTEAGPIGVMLAEHDEGRGRLAAVDDALPAAEQDDPTAVEAVAENLQAYVDLLRQHIAKEDNILYVMADQAFSEADQAALAAAFERIEAEALGEGAHERFHRLAHDLAER
ncbi:MAG: hemerythrin domain-containing protein [Planctomycetota bacterium]